MESISNGSFAFSNAISNYVSGRLLSRNKIETRLLYSNEYEQLFERYNLTNCKNMLLFRKMLLFYLGSVTLSIKRNFNYQIVNYFLHHNKFVRLVI